MPIVSTRGLPSGSPSSPIAMTLFVWKHGQEIFHRYAPLDHATFPSNSASQTLSIELVDLQGLGFSITHFTTNDDTHIDDIIFTDILGNIFQHGKPSAGKPSNFKSPAKKLEFSLSLPPGRGFYLNILLTDPTFSGGVRLLSCDPQVENGTKT